MLETYTIVPDHDGWLVVRGLDGSDAFSTCRDAIAFAETSARADAFAGKRGLVRLEEAPQRFRMVAEFIPSEGAAARRTPV